MRADYLVRSRFSGADVEWLAGGMPLPEMANQRVDRTPQMPTERRARPCEKHARLTAALDSRRMWRERSGWSLACVIGTVTISSRLSLSGPYARPPRSARLCFLRCAAAGDRGGVFAGARFAGNGRSCKGAAEL